MNRSIQPIPAALILVVIFVISCREKPDQLLLKEISTINLKKGPVVLCGPDNKEVGNVSFIVSAKQSIQKQFNFATALLHSFEYDEAEKAFAKIIEEDPKCAMAYWGVAMSNYHPLWTPPEEPELKKGARALAIAASLKPATAREADYINALSEYYKDWEKINHRTRCLRHEKAMHEMTKKYPDDKEVLIFYALALVAAADPADKTYARQQKAGLLLEELHAGPGHPGVVHYIIHTYDYPALAHRALPAARQYAFIAPASAHAQHMPSHIFTRLGLWDDCIRSNEASIAAAKCYAQNTGIKGHWDEELHGMDYLVYALLQKKDLKRAKEQWDYLKTFTKVSPPNFKGAYTFAAIPARYVLENRLWEEATDLDTSPAGFPMQQFPWQKAIIHFARLLGYVHTNQPEKASEELNTLQQLHEELLAKKETYNANQVNIQIKTSEAWILWKQGKNAAALEKMMQAADMEDKTEKHPVTPGEVLPARELLADMLLEMHQPEKALEAYELDLANHPNRYNGLFGAAVAAEQSGKQELANSYFQKLSTITGKQAARLVAAELTRPAYR
jgi:tetratricopeptide (TPR) repeat protein